MEFSIFLDLRKILFGNLDLYFYYLIFGINSFMLFFRIDLYFYYYFEILDDF